MFCIDLNNKHLDDEHVNWKKTNVNVGQIKQMFTSRSFPWKRPLLKFLNKTDNNNKQTIKQMNKKSQMHGLF